MPGALFVKGTDMPEEQQNLFSGEELAAQTSDPAARIEALRDRMGEQELGARYSTHG